MANINKIKLSGTTYNIEDLNASKTVELTQAEYDALPSSAKTNNTLFVITDAQGADLSQYWTSAQTESAITQAVSGKQDTLSAGTGIDITDNVISATGGGGDLSGYVTTDTEQIISGRKIFTYTSSGAKAIEFKQTDDSSKVGFTVRNSAETNNEVASFEFRPNTFTIDNVQHPLMYFGHYRNTNTANAGVPQTVIGFRQYDQKNGSAYHLLAPLPENARRPFRLTTSFQNFYMPLGIKVDNSTMVKADSGGVMDISSYIGGGGGGGITSGEVQTMIDESVSGKQDTLISGTNIKTINNESILGSGNITIQGGGGGGKAIEAGRGISVTTGETADTVSFNLPISAGTGSNSLVFGRYGAATGQYSTAFGNGSQANNNYAFAIGNANYANGSSSFAGGDGLTSAIASGSFAFGFNAETRGTNSVALGGYFLRTENDSEVALGNANVSQTGLADSDKTLFSVGNGTSSSARHNAFEIRQNGDIYITSGNTDIKLQDNLGGGGASYSAGTGIDITNDVISVSGVVESSAVTSAITSGSTDSEVPSSKAVYDKLGGLSIVKLTDTEYNALQNKDENTLYVVVSAATPTPSWVSYGAGDEVLAGSYSNLRIPSAVTFDDENSHFEIYLSNGNIAHIGAYCTETTCQEWDCAEYDEETGDCIEQGDSCLSEYCSIVDEGYCINSSWAFDKDVDSLTHFTYGQDGYWYLNEGFTVMETGDIQPSFPIEVLPNSI